MKTKTVVLNGKLDAGKPRVRFDEGNVASAKPRRGSLLSKFKLFFAVVSLCLSADYAFAKRGAYTGFPHVEYCGLWFGGTYLASDDENAVISCVHPRDDHRSGDGQGSVLKIPAEVNGHKVVEVSLNITATEVYAPDCIERIGTFMSDIKKFRCPASLIGAPFFNGTEAHPRPLEEIDLANIKTIGAPPSSSGHSSMGAFQWCTNLHNVNIPESVTNIMRSAFNHCEALERIKIPSKIRYIYNGTFNACYKLTRVELPEGLVEIGSSAFYGCPITDCLLPSSVTNIGANAFAYAKWDYVRIPDEVMVISPGAFSSNSRLLTIGWPSKIETIGDNAFSEAISLRELYIPAGVRNIDHNAFSGCTNLTKVVIPKTVTKIAYGAFNNVPAEIIFEGEPPDVSSGPIGSSSAARVITRGFYCKTFESKWAMAIDENGLWSGIKMERIEKPLCPVVADADLINGSITIDWSKLENGDRVGCDCELLRGQTEDIAEANVLQLTDQERETKRYVDEEYMSLGSFQDRVYYWVRPKAGAENSEKYLVSDKLVTRSRHCVSVGVDKYTIPSENLEARSSTAVEVATAYSASGLMFRLTDDEVKREAVLSALDDVASKAIPGDVVMYFHSSHGRRIFTPSGVLSGCGIAVHDSTQCVSAKEIATVLKKIKQGVCVIFVIDACHSGAMRDEIISIVKNEAHDLLPYFAFITSTKGGETSCSYKEYAFSTKGFWSAGWKHGGAATKDATTVTFGDLARFAASWLLQAFDFRGTKADISNEELLNAVVAGNVAEHNCPSISAAPLIETSTRVGDSILMKWSPVDGANHYRIFRLCGDGLTIFGRVDSTQTMIPNEVVASPRFFVKGFSDDIVGPASQIISIAGAGVQSVAYNEAWASQYSAFSLIYGDDLEKAKTMPTGKKSPAGDDLTVYDDFIVGTDPTDVESEFKLSISIADGIPKVHWSPALNGDCVRSGIRDYVIMGSNNLKDWEPVPENQESAYNFFKVKVALPKEY